MRSNDRILKITLIWIGIMLTLLVADKFLTIPTANAQDNKANLHELLSDKPVEVIVKGTVKIDIAEWSDYQDRVIKIKIDDPWPARISIDDPVEVKGELRLRD